MVGVVLLALLFGGAAVWRIRGADAAVPRREAIWALTRVQASVFGAVSTIDIGCFSLRTDASDVRVFVVDASYTNYESMHCEKRIRRDHGEYLVTITQSWEDRSTPDGSGPIGWIRRLLYRPPFHSWSYRIRPDGRVLVLPEHGEPPPQSYVH